MQFKFSILEFVFVALLLSCDGINRKGQEVVDRTKQKVIAKKNAVVDNVLPTFDSYSPDTKFNQKRFEEFFGFPPTPDVSEIYCFGDQIGIDSKFQFSFRCDTTTKNRIINYLNLVRTNQPDNFSSGLWQNFSWWDSAKITTLNPYWYRGAHESFRYLWFDYPTQKLYYMEFDM